MEVMTYYQIKKIVEREGKVLEVRELAKELQLQLSEPGANIPFKDAYEMAYNEILLQRVY
jgi:hypothetical protein